MAETTWVNGVVGKIDSTEQIFAANTAINLYNASIDMSVSLLKKGPNGIFYPSSTNGSPKLQKRDSSFVLATGGTYKIVGTSSIPLYITFEAL